jgi:hypothetical protein
MNTQILTINRKYNIYVFNIDSDNNFFRSSFSFNNIKYPDLNDFIIRSSFSFNNIRYQYPDLNDFIIGNSYKPLCFTLNNENFEGAIEQYSSTWHKKGQKDVDSSNIILNKKIYGFDNDEIKNLKMDLTEYINSTTYGQLVIRKNI